MAALKKYIFLIATAAFSIVTIIAIVFGAVHITLSEMWQAIVHTCTVGAPQGIHENVFIQIRLPRVLLCGITGAALALSGAVMQGLFRNPVVEPGLAGTSAGAAFGASIVFVLSAGWSVAFKTYTGPLLVPICAFAGGWLATYIVYQLAKSMGHSSITTMLLLGIAMNAIAMSGTGFMSYIARDPQARSITFWNLGTFAGAAWWQVGIVFTVVATCAIYLLRVARPLDILQLGEAEAAYLGVETQQLKRNVLLVNTCVVSVVTAFTGVIGFMGLIVPHITRLIVGSTHQRLLPLSMLIGATLLLVADIVARLLLAPAEMPIGIITSLVGAPVFILLLRKTALPNVKEGGGDA